MLMQKYKLISRITRKPKVTLTILVPFYLPVILNYDQDLQADYKVSRTSQCAKYLGQWLLSTQTHNRLLCLDQ